MIEDATGAVELLTDEGDCAAAWLFADLMISWNEKHAQAAYIPYESEKVNAPATAISAPHCLAKVLISIAILLHLI